MKKLLLFFTIFLFCTTLNAEIVRENNTFKSERRTENTDTKTQYTWEDKDGNKYPIFISKKGACFVIRTSKKGNEYKYYLPKEVQETIRTELKWEEKVS